MEGLLLTVEIRGTYSLDGNVTVLVYNIGKYLDNIAIMTVGYLIIIHVPLPNNYGYEISAYLIPWVLEEHPNHNVIRKGLSH